MEFKKQSHSSAVRCCCWERFQIWASQHKWGVGVERRLKSVLLIHTTFGITILSTEKFLKQWQNTSYLYVEADSDKICLHVANQNHSQYKTYYLQQSLYQMRDWSWMLKAMAIQDEKVFLKDNNLVCMQKDG